MRCAKGYHSSKSHDFFIYLDVPCDISTHSFTLTLAQCELCSHPWLEICLILFLLFVVLTTFLPFNKDQFVLALTVFQAALTIFLCVWKLIPLWILVASVVIFALRLKKNKKSLHTLISIFVLYLQLLFARFHLNLIDLVNQNKKLKDFVDAVEKIVNLEGFQLHCLFTDITDELVVELVFLALLPIFVLLFSLVIFGFWYAFSQKECNEHFYSVRDRCAAFALSFFNFAYFPILNHTISFILDPCQSIAPRVSIMKKYPWIECGSGKEIRAHTIAIVIIIIYIAVPFVFFLPLLYKYRSQISNKREELNAGLWFSAIFSPYKTKYRVFMHTIVLMNKILLAFMLSAQLKNPILAHGVMVPLIIFGVMKPFKIQKDNNSNRLQCGCCGITRTMKEVGIENFFMTGFLFVVFNTIIFESYPGYVFYSSSSFQNHTYGNSTSGTGYSATTGIVFPGMILATAMNIAMVFVFLVYVIIPRCCFCGKKDNTKYPLLSDTTNLRNRYAAFSDAYILLDASSLDEIKG